MTLQPGDRIAYAAKFLKNTCQLTGAAPQRRGTYLGPHAGMPERYSRVRWDDEAEYLAQRADDPEYCLNVRTLGSMVATINIAKVGSPRFALTDL